MKSKQDMTKLFDDEAAPVIKALNITGNTADLGWDQERNGLIGANAIITHLGLQKLPMETKQELISLCGVIGNTSQNGQRLFATKKAKKATVLADALLKVVR
jgi:hypothetical protein